MVDLIKKHKKAVTLAIGDGANDVSMIKSEFENEMNATATISSLSLSLVCSHLSLLVLSVCCSGPYRSGHFWPRRDASCSGL